MLFSKRMILKTIAFILLIEGIVMIPSWLLSIFYEEYKTFISICTISTISILVGIVILKLIGQIDFKLKLRDGLMITLLSWLTVCIIGALPYYFSGNGYSFVDSIFESVAGWTTTSSWVIPKYTLPKGLMLWKATSNWLGGIGILVIAISIFPTISVGGKSLVASELTGPELKKMTSRLRDTAKITYIIYFVLTFLAFALLAIGEMSTLDALLNAMSTVSTAGIFDSVGEIMSGFSPYTKTVITLITIFASVNFYIYFLLSIGQWKKVLKNVEVITYLTILLFCSIISAGALYFTGTYDTLWSAFGNATAQTVSYGATSGFSVANVNNWPAISQITLVALMIIGGCSLSTSGSIKMIRAIVCFKLVIRGVYKRIHPRAIKPVMLAGEPVSASMASAVTVYVILFFAVYAIGVVLLSLENKDMTTTITAALSSLSNTGGGLGLMVNANYGIFSNFGKIVASLLMLIGRLELYPIAVLFTKAFWKPDSVS